MKYRVVALFTIGILAVGLGGCGSSSDEQSSGSTVDVPVGESHIIYVAEDGDDEGDGTESDPYATIQKAVDNMAPGDEVIVEEGTYAPFTVTAAESGSENGWSMIHGADDAEVVISREVLTPAATEEEADQVEDQVGIHMINTSYISLYNFEVVGGTHGIYYESTGEQGENELSHIHISDCIVHDVHGTHGICVYARNDLAPVTDLVIENNQVYDCTLGSSESVVVNGNIDGFSITGNVIHDNDNIGIDMIGFEGTAAHEEGTDCDNVFDADFVRNGACYGNVVYNISADGNYAYLEDGEYDLCADGIYVDGGQDIEIYENFIFNCDIGLEVATEHSPLDNEIFEVSGMKVHDNVIAGCVGWCGICFGGYDADLGFTHDCEFYNNTLVDNDTQFGVQRSYDNKIYNNVVVGGWTAMELSEDIAPEDMDNAFRDNVWSVDDKKEVARSEALSGFTSLVEGKGSSYVPADEYIEIYEQLSED